MLDSMDQTKQQFVWRVRDPRHGADQLKGYEEREDWNVAESVRQRATPNGLCGQ